MPNIHHHTAGPQTGDFLVHYRSAGPTAPPTVVSDLPAILAIEPRLAKLLDCAGTHHNGSKRSRWWHYEVFKRHLSRLVGWHADRPELQTSACYETCIKALARALGV